jgi:hypothetical protein
MDKDDLYFFVSTALGLVACLGMDWKLVKGRLSMPSLNRRNLLFVSLILGSLGLSAFGWHKSIARRDQITGLSAKNAELEKEKGELAAKLFSALMLPAPTKQISDGEKTQLISRLGTQFSTQYPLGTRDEKQAWVNSEIRRYGYTFQFTYVHVESPLRKLPGGNVPLATKDNPCPLGHIEIDDAVNYNMTNGLTTEGRVPCITYNRATNIGGTNGALIREKTPPPTSLKPQ